MIEMTPFPLRGGRPAWSTAVGLGPIPYRFAGSNPAPRIPAVPRLPRYLFGEFDKGETEGQIAAGIAQLGQRRCVQVAVLIGSQVRILLPAPRQSPSQ